MIDYNLLGKRVAALRKERKLTQERLAEMAGISNNYLSNIENCYSIPSLETLMNICIALEVTPDSVLVGTSEADSEYMNIELMKKISSCTPKEKRMIDGFINLLIKER